jgi:hypothetical protein
MSEHSGNRCPLANAYHRITGKKNYFFDFDNMGTSSGDISFYMGVNMPDFAPKYFLDFKRQNNAIEQNTQSVSTKWFAMQGQIAHANFCKAPFLIVLTYLSDEYAVKSYFIIPANSYAKDFFKQYNLSEEGIWRSLKGFSKLLHTIKGNKFDPTEEIPFKDRWNDFVKVSNADKFTLGDLPSDYIQYPLPHIEVV